jgi:hypothetical protein
LFFSCEMSHRPQNEKRDRTFRTANNQGRTGFSNWTSSLGASRTFSGLR